MIGYTQELSRQFSFLSAATVRRLTRAYGTRASKVLGSATSDVALGEDFGAGLTEAEVDYLRREEWAVTADDILWRRSKLGLRTSAADKERLNAYLGVHGSSPSGGQRQEENC